MINVSVLSSDALFARMLCLEISAMGREGGFSASVNDYETLYMSDGVILVLDLDSAYADNSFEIKNIIGFSTHPVPDKKIYSKCRAVLHRPFRIDELKNVILETAAEYDPEMNLLARKNEKRLKLNASDCAVFDGRKIHLSPLEMKILKELYENNGSIVDRGRINEIISSSGGNISDVYIFKLREKLEGDGAEKLIYTIRGKGYMLKI